MFVAVYRFWVCVCLLSFLLCYLCVLRMSLHSSVDAMSLAVCINAIRYKLYVFSELYLVVSLWNMENVCMMVHVVCVSVFLLCRVIVSVVACAFPYPPCCILPCFVHFPSLLTVYPLQIQTNMSLHDHSRKHVNTIPRKSPVFLTIPVLHTCIKMSFFLSSHYSLLFPTSLLLSLTIHNFHISKNSRFRPY